MNMKSIVTCSFVFVAAASIGAATAQADELNRKKVITAECTFQDFKKDHCTASVVFCEKENGPGNLDRERCEDNFTVVCNGETIYDGDFRFEKRSHVVVIKAIPAPPVLKIKKTEDFPDTVPAWLRVNSTVLTGSCEVDKHGGRNP